MSNTISSDADLPYPLLLARSNNELAIKTQAHKELFHLDTAAWEADLEAGEIIFTSEKVRAKAALQIIGTLNQNDGTWLWAWANESIPENLCTHAYAVKAYGEKHGISKFCSDKFQCTEAEAWEFTALGCKLGGGQGAYRGPAGSTLVYITFGTPSISKV
jgi:hypothetical protein